MITAHNVFLLLDLELTEVAGRIVRQISVKLCSMSFFQSRTQTKIWQLHVSLWTNQRHIRSPTHPPCQPLTFTYCMSAIKTIIWFKKKNTTFQIVLNSFSFYLSFILFLFLTSVSKKRQKEQWKLYKSVSLLVILARKKSKHIYTSFSYDPFRPLWSFCSLRDNQIKYGYICAVGPNHWALLEEQWLILIMWCLPWSRAAGCQVWCLGGWSPAGEWSRWPGQSLQCKTEWPLQKECPSSSAESSCHLQSRRVTDIIEFSMLYM